MQIQRDPWLSTCVADYFGESCSHCVAFIHIHQIFRSISNLQARAKLEDYAAAQILLTSAYCRTDSNLIYHESGKRNRNALNIHIFCGTYFGREVVLQTYRKYAVVRKTIPSIIYTNNFTFITMQQFWEACNLEHRIKVEFLHTQNIMMSLNALLRKQQKKYIQWETWRRLLYTTSCIGFIACLY